LLLEGGVERSNADAAHPREDLGGELAIRVRLDVRDDRGEPSEPPGVLVPGQRVAELVAACVQERRQDVRLQLRAGLLLPAGLVPRLLALKLRLRR